MRKIITCCLIAALATALPKISKAQDTSTIHKLLTYMIEPLDKSQIPTQYLAEKGTIYLGMNTFNGTLNDDNLFVLNLWRLMYVQLHQSYVGNDKNPMSNILSVNNALQANMILDQPTAIPILIGQYNSVSDNAISNGLLTYNSSTRQIYDVPNRSNSPYLSKNVFAACPLENFSTTGIASVMVKNNLVFNNTNASLSSVQIDFANGQGFVNIPLNVAVNANYTDTGYYKWTIKVTLSNNTVLQCYADYYVLNVATANRYAASGTNGPIVPSWGTINAVSGVHSGGTIHIVYSNKSRSNTLRKPLIVVENMDAYNLAPQVQIRPYTINSFLDGLDEPLAFYDFNAQLDDIAGYDLLFINFNDGMDGIVRNAAVVEEAINRVNANKVYDNRSMKDEQNVVLGVGTGGLNARYALAKIAKASGVSQTRLLITHDAPHRGQNIALGLQYLVKFINKSTAYSYNLGQVFPEHGQTVAYFNSKVCKDVLIYKAATEPGDVVENSFINDVYQPMISFAPGTQPFKFVPTSLGNECARPLFEAGRRFMDFGESSSIGTKIKVSLGLLIGKNSRWDISLFSIPVSELKFETVIFARSIPLQSDPLRTITAYKHVNKLTLFGSVQVFKNGADNSASAATTLLPIDGVPGSNMTLLDFTQLRIFQAGIGNFYYSSDEYITTLFKIKLFWGLALKFSLYGFAKAQEYNSGIFTTQYTAVPVASALDVSPFNANTFTEKYVNGVNSNYPSKGETFIAQESVFSQSLYNNVSMRYTARNARFMYNEMEGLPNLMSCSNECVNQYKIIGPDPLCSSGIYKLNALTPTGSNIAWSISPSNLATPNPTTGVSTTFTKTGDGLGTITASIINGCPNTGASKVVQVGIQTPTNIIGLVPPLGVSPGEILELGAAESDISQYNWFVLGGTIAGSSTQSQVTIIVDNCPPGLYNGWLNVFLWYTNQCGTGYYGEYTTIDCGTGGEMLRLAPNPSTGPLDVSIYNKNGKPIANGRDKIKQLLVLNKFGVVLQTINYGNGVKNAIINISNLSPDVYSIRAYNGTEWLITKLLKQ